jgi:hypothetical protein
MLMLRSGAHNRLMEQASAVLSYLWFAMIFVALNLIVWSNLAAELRRSLS